jgi:hypothetical protein
MKPEFSRETFEKKYSNIKFHENPSSGSLVVSRGRTDRWTHKTWQYQQYLFAILRKRLTKCQSHDNKTGKVEKYTSRVSGNFTNSVRACSVVTASTNLLYELYADSAHASSLDCERIWVGGSGGREAVVMRRQSLCEPAARSTWPFERVCRSSQAHCCGLCKEVSRRYI